MKNEGKLRLLNLYEILYCRSDESHPISTNELINILKDEFGIPAHRITIATDIEVLKEFGVDIETIASSQNKYYIASRKFELPELKMLIDAVNFSKFITKKKSKKIVDKLCSFASDYQSYELLSGSHISTEGKVQNEKIYYIIDAVNCAIKEKKKISFRYYRYILKNDALLRQSGEAYHLSPYALVWNGDFYYVLGYSDKHKRVTTFRIDKIADVPTILNNPAEEKPDSFDISRFIKTAFRMYEGELKNVTVLFDNDLIGSVVDKFGTDIKITPVDENTSSITAQVMISPVFFRWIFGFGGKIKILSPESVKKQYADMIKNAYNNIMEEEK